ncbi:hypothetical protein [Pengzhenrongella sicca]|uniref:Uncharacterized protein n=1 Tax=Pengzhenrongella sicca TaxID=2819238 RepID=A0A8A4ZIQ6_9MICO|nr:hypothetical protein [Pengzhenrongella sicca]QTE30859.1 hypothetical protein J4E96_08000 [Pengzhenrongella sicca]
MTNPNLSVSVEYAEKAAAVVAKLKPGTYEAANTLANISIAASLARIADAMERT